MVQIYRSKWGRGYFSSLFGYLRDVLVFYLPLKKLPPFLLKFLYGGKYQFAFLVHPRAYQDCFISLPFLSPAKLLLRKKTAYKVMSKTSPFILNTVRTPHGVNGLVIAQLTLPEIMFDHRKDTLRMLEKALKIVSKICEPGAAVGLGGWFPMVTRRGAALKSYSDNLHLTVTNGHCGTLASMYMTVERIAEIVGLPLSELSVAIIGVGKMGTNVARALNGRVKELLLIDINEKSVKKTAADLSNTQVNTHIEVCVFQAEDMQGVKEALKKSHIGLCATSSLRNLLKIKDLPVGYIAIDDSRPEALPRDPKNERIILEGGLLKIEGAEVDYNYGFGSNDNVFGCLGEAFLLALDKQKTLKPTLAEVDFDNFFRVINFCHNNNVSEGDLKSSDVNITAEEVVGAFQRRGFIKTEEYRA